MINLKRKDGLIFMGWFFSILLLLSYMIVGSDNAHADYMLIASGLFAIAGTIGFNLGIIANKFKKD